MLHAMIMVTTTPVIKRTLLTAYLAHLIWKHRELRLPLQRLRDMVIP